MFGHRISRHLVPGALVLAACSAPLADAGSGPSVAGVTTLTPATTSSPAPPPSSAAPSTLAEPAPTTTTSTPAATAQLDPVDPYEPSPSDVLIDRKRIGGRFAQAIATHAAATTVDQHVDDLSRRFGLEPNEEFRTLVAEVTEPGRSAVGTVRYAQMGGNRATTASIMVWVDQERLAEDGTRTSESRVFDVRIELVEGVWVVDELASAGGPSVDRPDDLTDLAAAVVDHPSISMPDSARWDIYSGHTTDAMLQRMLDIAQDHRYAVLVLHRGHPFHVFATDKVSRHSVGQAMDVHEVDGGLVVDSRFEGSPAWTLSRNLFDGGIGSIGSPWAFDGFGGRSFTDDVHQDHLHITSL